MTYIATIPDDEATGAVAEMYEADRLPSGAVPNYTRAFSLRPHVYAAWRALNAAVRGGMDQRRYELVSVAAARRLRSSYCALAHGSILLDQGMLDADTLRSLADGDGSPALGDVDVAVMDLADQVAGDAASVTEEDVERLRRLGLDDGEIADVVLAAAMRCFFSKVLDGLGARPDARFAGLAPEVRDALTVGRPIAEA